MKKTILLSVLAGACGALVLGAAVDARGQQTPFYAKFDLGGNWTHDLELKEFFGPVTPGSKVKLDPGLRAGLTGGYEFKNWLAGELQIGVFENRINSITDATRVHDATFLNMPLLFNLKLQYPNRTRFTPYIGGGGGVSAVVLDARHIDLNGVDITGADADAVFAYQGFAGVRYKLNDHMGISLEYRYFGAGAPSWDADFTDGSGSGHLRFGRAETHSISLAFDYHF